MNLSARTRDISLTGTRSGPVVVPGFGSIGPSRSAHHHWPERLHTPYAFEILPRLLLKVLSQFADSD